MFGKILGKKKDDNDNSNELLEATKKIQKMNLTEMRSYVNNKISTFKVSSIGLLAIMHKLTLADSSTNKLYILEDDMDSKKKKAFELVLMITKNKKIDFTVLETIQTFTQVYQDIIAKYDIDNKEIYASRFKEMLAQAIAGFAALEKQQNKMNVLGS